MKKRLTLALLALAGLASTASAQLNGDGYYRVQNVTTKRYMTMCDNRGGVNAGSTTPDLAAMRTVLNLHNVIDAPSSVFYIEHQSGGYVLHAQGCNSYDLTGYYLQISDRQNGTYWAYGSYAGMTLYIRDSETIVDPYMGDTLYTATATTSTSQPRDWYILPFDNNGTNYFGLQPQLGVGGKYYQTFYAEFPFSFHSSGMKARYVKLVDTSLGVAVWDEVTGTVVAPETPVIVECSSNLSGNNKMNILDNVTPAAVTGNLLRGNYFANDVEGKHRNVVDYNPATMRVLGTTSDGKLGLVKSNISILPENSAYLTVPAGSPDELVLMTADEYEAFKASDAVTITATSYTREYGEENPAFGYTVEGADLRGEPVLSCEATASSPVGTYAITVSKGTVSNAKVTLVPGTLTVTKASLTIAAGEYTREQGEPNPTFTLSYEGFRLSETNSVLTKQPVATCAADESSEPGEYVVVVSGAEAQNYDISYVNGKLTVTEVSGIADIELSASRPAPVYSLTGMLVRRHATTLQGLPKGVYVVRGRKVVVK